MLRIYGVALEVAAELSPYIDALMRRAPAHADQLDRALGSVVGGISEGSRSRGKNRNNHYSRACGSMDEAIGVIDYCTARGYAAPVDHATIEKMRRVVGTLVKVSR